MTIPNIAAKYQQMVLRNQFKVAYSLINQAMLTVVQKNGVTPECWYWNKIPYPGYTCDEPNHVPGSICHGNLILPDGSPLPDDYNGRFGECTLMYNLLFNELKVVSECKRSSKNKCTPDYKGKEVVNASPDKTEEEALRGCAGLTTSVLASGTYKILANGMIMRRFDRMLIVDTNGSKGPNKWGYDVFMFTPQLYSSNSSGIIELGSRTTACTIKEEGGFTTKEMLENMGK